MFVLPVTRSFSRVPSVAAARHLDRIVGHLFDTGFNPPTAIAGPRVPALDVGETDAAYQLTFDLPGAAREQLKVSVEGRRVSLETLLSPNAAEARAPGVDAAATATAVPAENSQPRNLYRERGATNFARVVSLPAEVDQAASQAKFENGVLTLTLAKKVPTGATQLQIA